MVSKFQPFRLMNPVLVFLVLIGVSYWVNPVAWQRLSAGTEVLFVAAAVVFLAVMVAMRRKGHLRMDERGLEVQYVVGAPRVYAWEDIESARIVRVRFLLIPMFSTIRLTLSAKARSKNAVRRMAGAVTNSDATFPAFFEESAQEIVEKIRFQIEQRRARVD